MPAEAMGIRSRAENVGITFDIVVRTSTSAAGGVVNRKVRRRKELWLQDAGEENVADTFSKNMKSEVLGKLLEDMGFIKVLPREMDGELTGRT